MNGVFTNVGASPVPDGPIVCSPLAAADVWFIHFVEGPGTTRVIRTCPPTGDTTSLPDSVIQVFPALYLPGAPTIPIPGIALACNDDSCGQRSSVTVTGLSEGDPLLIRVASPPSPVFPFPNILGTFRLEVTGGPAPSNNNCAGAIPLAGAAGLWGGFTNLFATLTTGVPSFCIATGADVWYSWVAPCTGTATFSTCTTPAAPWNLADTVLQVLTGTCGSLTALGCNDDACGSLSSVAVPVVAGQTYYVRVGEFAYGGFQDYYDWGFFDISISYTGGTGTFTSLATECGSFVSGSLDATGNPTPGGSVSYSFPSSNPGLPALIWIGTTTLVPLCPTQGCLLGATPLVVFPGSSLSATVPCGAGLVGVTFAVQGASLLTNDGCPAAVYGVGFEVTSTIVTTIG
jgi:hypothetical protein